MNTRLLKTFVILYLPAFIFSFLFLMGVIIILNPDKNFLSINAQQNTTNNPCPQTMTMVGATYVDKQGCIQPCPTSDTQGQIPAGCPQPSQQQSSQSMQQPSLQPPQQQQSLQPFQQEQSQPAGEQQLQPPQQQPQPQEQQPALAPQQEQSQPAGEQQLQPQEQQQLQPPQQQQPQLNQSMLPQNRALANKNTLINPSEIELGNDTVKFGVHSCPSDLSGIWQGNDGGTYYIKQFGSSILWFGSNIFNGNAKGIKFANEANGIAANGTIHVIWFDSLYISDIHQGGFLTLNVDPSNSKLEKVGSKGDFFGGSEWSRICIS